MYIPTLLAPQFLFFIFGNLLAMDRLQQEIDEMSILRILLDCFIQFLLISLVDLALIILQWEMCLLGLWLIVLAIHRFVSNAFSMIMDCHLVY